MKNKMIRISHNTVLLFANRVSVPLILAISAWTLYSVIDLKDSAGQLSTMIAGNAKNIEAQESRINSIEAFLFGQRSVSNNLPHR